MLNAIKSLEEYRDAYQQSIEHPEVYWENQAIHFNWRTKWNKVLEWDFVSAHTKWFIGGQLNITENCLDRHLPENSDRIAIRWEPNEPGNEVVTLTYHELHVEVCRFASGLRQIGITKGDRVCMYMPMIPQLAIAMLACARIGAIHSVVFAGFSAQSLAERINDAGCKIVVCSGHNSRGAKSIPVKAVVDEAIAIGCPTVEKVIVYGQPDEELSWKGNRDLWWDELIDGQLSSCESAVMDAEDPLFILYTSGSTGQPKGVVHTCGGYMVFAEYTFRNVFQYRENEIYWCTADIGWITGHTYTVYGPLLAGATILMFEGIPTYPDASRFWKVIEKHKVNIFYTAPTAIRSLMAAGDHFTEGHDLSTLRVIGSVGEPINSEAWHWYHDKTGKGSLPLVDTWWQTETGGIMISPIAGVTDHVPCHASYPLPGVQPLLVTADGKLIEGNEEEGLLCIRYPWPAIIRTTWRDHERCRQNYFSQFPGLYFTGDGAKRDAQGRYRIIGRVDDVINVSGHRIGTAEVENAINEHPAIVESAVVGYPHPIKGNAIFAFVVTPGEEWQNDKLLLETNNLLTDKIGAFCRVDKLMAVTGLPKTRSGKIMRRILRKLAEGNFENLGDISTLFNPEVIENIITGLKKTN